MKWKLIISEEAVKDLTDAASWYETQKNDLGLEFINEVEKVFLTIKLNPFIFQIQRSIIRHGYVNRFPYIIIYEVEKIKVVVYAVIRAEQKPAKRYKRVKK